MRDYRRLKVFQRSHAFALRTYRVTHAYPSDERFGLVAQTRRSVASIPMNIAEGSGRSTEGDYARFITYAAASCNEADYQLLLARDLGYLPAAEFDPMRRELSELRSMLTSLARTLSHPDETGPA